MTTQYTSICGISTCDLKIHANKNKSGDFSIGDKIIILNEGGGFHRSKYIKRKRLLKWARVINEHSSLFSTIYKEYNRMLRNPENFQNYPIHVNALPEINYLRALGKMTESMRNNNVFFPIPPWRYKHHSYSYFKPGLIGYINNIQLLPEKDKYNVFQADLSDIGTADYVKLLPDTPKYERHEFNVRVYDLGKYIGTGRWKINKIIKYNKAVELIEKQ